VTGGPLSYDGAGNVINDGNHAYTYDAADQLTQVNDQNGNAIASYVYDGSGQRVVKTSNGTTVQYLYDASGHMVMEENSVGWADREEVYAGGQHLVTQLYNQVPSPANGEMSSPTYYIARDALGNERMRSTLDGTSYESCMSLPFGDGLTCTGPAEGDVSPLHFTGKERDAESGNDYFGARYYANSMGRFLSPDDGTGERLQNPQSLNRYSYAFNNPLILVDPSGHSTQTANNGDVLAAYDDGDNGVYQHSDIDNRADWDGSKLDSDDEGANYMGETQHWDEFAKIKDGKGVNGTAARNAHIHFGASIDQQIRELNAGASAEDLIEVALQSRNGGSLDIKATSSLADYGSATGYLLNGYYATMETAGNYLAGLDAMTSTRARKYISPEFAQKLFGAYQAGGGGLKGLWAVQQTYRTGNAAPGTQAPYWGETEYSGRMQQEGIAAGVSRR
jgi:RHS repeat-associated protein